MDSATFMERYGYTALLIVAALVVIGIFAAVSSTFLALLREFGGYMVALIVIGIVIYVLLSRGRGRNRNAETERENYERGLRRY